MCVFDKMKSLHLVQMNVLNPAWSHHWIASHGYSQAQVFFDFALTTTVTWNLVTEVVTNVNKTKYEMFVPYVYKVK